MEKDGSPLGQNMEGLAREVECNWPDNSVNFAMARLTLRMLEFLSSRDPGLELLLVDESASDRRALLDVFRQLLIEGKWKFGGTECEVLGKTTIRSATLEVAEGDLPDGWKKLEIVITPQSFSVLGFCVSEGDSYDFNELPELCFRIMSEEVLGEARDEQMGRTIDGGELVCGTKYCRDGSDKVCEIFEWSGMETEEKTSFWPKSFSWVGRTRLGDGSLLDMALGLNREWYGVFFKTN